MSSKIKRKETVTIQLVKEYIINIAHKGLLQRRSKNVLSREYIFQKGVYSILNLL